MDQTFCMNKIRPPKQALQKCKYPVWNLNRANIKSNRSNKGSSNTRNNPTPNINKPHIVVQYIQGLGDSCKNIYSKHGIHMHFKGGRTIKDLLVNPKDRDTILQKSGVIYTCKCSRVDCEEECSGETEKTFAERSKGHMKAPSPSMIITTPLVITYL